MAFREPGARLDSAGGGVDAVQVILEGSVRVGDPDGTMIELGPGRPIGMIGLLSDTPRLPVTVTTASKAARATHATATCADGSVLACLQ